MTKNEKVSLGVAIGAAALLWFGKRATGICGTAGIGRLLSAKDYDDYTTYFGDERDYRVGDWYVYKYPHDSLGKDVNKGISFNQLYILMQYGVPVYELIGVGDSIVRERIFQKLAEIYHVPYDHIYNMWLDS